MQVNAPVVINFTSGSEAHLPGGAPDEFLNYNQSGFSVTPQVAVDGVGAHIHLENGSMYTHVHVDELGGPGVVTFQDQNGVSMFMVDSIVVPRLDNFANGGSLTLTDSNGDTLTVTPGGDLLPQLGSGLLVHHHAQQSARTAADCNVPTSIRLKSRPFRSAPRFTKEGAERSPFSAFWLLSPLQ